MPSMMRSIIAANSSLETYTPAIVMGSSETLETRDGGKTFTVIADAPYTTDPVNYAIRLSNGTIIVSTFNQPRGVKYLEKGQSTWKTSSGIPSTEYVSCLFDDGNGLTLCGTTLGIYRSFDHGVSWTKFSPNINIGISFIFKLKDGSLIAQEAVNTAPLKAIVNMDTVPSLVNYTASSVERIIHVKRIEGGALIAGARACRVYKSIDEGKTWTPYTLYGGNVSAMNTVSSVGKLILVTSKARDTSSISTSSHDGGVSFNRIQYNNYDVIAPLNKSKILMVGDTGLTVTTFDEIVLASFLFNIPVTKSGKYSYCILNPD